MSDSLEPHLVGECPDEGATGDAQQLVPVWLAALVLVLLLAVVGVGGFVVRGVLGGDGGQREAVELEVDRWEDAVKLNPDDLDARLSLGFAYQQGERYEEALKQYDYVLDRAPRDLAALYNRGAVLYRLGRYDDAEAAWWDVLETDPGHVLAAKALGELYADRREYRSLIVAVRPVVEQNESAADLQYLMGVAYENLGRTDWARARYQLALKYYPDMQEARDALERLGIPQ